MVTIIKASLTPLFLIMLSFLPFLDKESLTVNESSDAVTITVYVFILVAIYNFVRIMIRDDNGRFWTIMRYGLCLLLGLALGYGGYVHSTLNIENQKFLTGMWTFTTGVIVVVAWLHGLTELSMAKRKQHA